MERGIRSRSERLGAARYGVLPYFVAVAIKYQIRVSGRRIPDIMGQLVFQLPCRPAGVTEGNEAFAGPWFLAMSSRTAWLGVAASRASMRRVSGRR